MDVWSPDRLADHKKRFKKIGWEEGQQPKPPEKFRKVDGKPPFSH